MTRKLRLLVTERCERNCRGCCNQDWDLSRLQVESDYSGYDEVSLTGGEPLLEVERVEAVIRLIRESSQAKVWMYSAKLDNPELLCRVFKLLDGLTLTLHDQEDVARFSTVDSALREVTDYRERSKRLNVFKGLYDLPTCSRDWIVKGEIEWIQNCPLPKGEVF